MFTFALSIMQEMHMQRLIIYDPYMANGFTRCVYRKQPLSITQPVMWTTIE